MTLWGAVAAIRRRWYLIAIGMLCTALALYVIQTRPPVLMSRAMVYFLAPASEYFPNVVETRSFDLVDVAGIVGKRINGSSSLSKTASTDVTLVGRGIDDGSSIKLPDHGGQWSAYYDTQALDIQITAPTEEEIRSRQAEIFARIDSELSALQDELGVPTQDRVATKVLPDVPTIQVITGDRHRAQAMTLVLGVGLSLLAVGEAELRAARQKLQPGRVAPTLV